ncbi:MAG: squalene synthase HpnC [Alphaproteobacteria bacterium]|nr:squalene synthase HpnC [Alphaproteobacteria bacterium]
MTTQPDTASGKNRNTENFPVGSILIRADLRPHVHALYRFAREADDISDHPLLDAREKISRLEKFAVTLLDDKNDEIPAAAALRQSLRQTGVSPQHALDLLTAFKRDATQLRYRDWHDLIDYCTFSAAPVGRHMLALHGVGQEAWKASDALCNALQIINHIQDCAEDYRELDRVYLPQDMLAAHGATTNDLSREKSTEGLRAVLMEMLDRVDPLLLESKNLPRQIPDWRLKAEVSVIWVLAQRLVALLRKRDPLCEDVKLSKPAVLAATVVGVARALV